MKGQGQTLSLTVAAAALGALFFLNALTLSSTTRNNGELHSYKCINGFCEKTLRRFPSTESNEAVSLGECRLLCNDAANIWPKPTGALHWWTNEINKKLVALDINDITITLERSKKSLGVNDRSQPVGDLLSRAAKRFKNILIASNLPKKSWRLNRNPNKTTATQKKIEQNTTTFGTNGVPLHVTVKLKDLKTVRFRHNLNEKYKLKLILQQNRLLASIKAKNFFGARHALETLSQLAFYDEIRNEIRMPSTFKVNDGPKYTHRGLMLDTARNYISVEAIKRTLEGMAASKLNVFHWHLTDSHSFPYVSASAPQLSRLGAYTQDKVYDADDVREIVEFARERGIMVLPEFDAPAHVGEGWQNTDLLACFNKMPWPEYCAEPPCGQLDPTQEGVYKMLGKIYKDMVRQFDPSVFHMGGDEVNENCWQSEERIVRWMQDRNMSIGETGFMRLWDHFQRKALQAYEKERGHRTPIIMWTSKLTTKPYLTKYLNNDTYVIQIWSSKYDLGLKHILDNDFKVIVSNYDAMYLDCGFSAWVGTGEGGGNNWCSPYKSWQSVYANDPAKVARGRKGLVLGSEVALWTEQADDRVIDARLFPRASAMAETLWTDPKTSWKEAEDRFVVHRELLVRLGIDAESVQPIWCQQHQNSCPMD